MSEEKFSLPDYVGYYDEPHQATPTYTPPPTVACPLCGKAIGQIGRVRPDGKSVLINHDIWGPIDPRSLFFKVHRDCQEADAASGGKELGRVISLLVDGPRVHN